MTLKPRVVRELRLADGYVSAASGLARARGRLYVAADDQHALLVFGSSDAGPGERLPLTAEDAGPVEKAVKPDLEAVAALPAAGLVVLGSGSTDRRHRGFVTSL